MTNYFEKNVEIWARSQPREAVLLSYVDDEELIFCETELGEQNLKCPSDKAGNFDYFHSQQGAALEAKKWFESFDTSTTELLYVYGVGLGYYYEEALSWLKKDSKHLLVFLEDNIGVLQKFFQTERAYRILSNRQVKIIYLEDPNSDKSVIGELNWDFVFAEASISALEYYKNSKSTLYDNLKREIPFGTAIKKELLSEYLNYGAAYFSNCYQNLMDLHHSYLGNALFGKFKKVPAIICGAGPSLEKNRHLLKGLELRALIFSGGSATNALNSIGVQPHFCVGIDPNSEQQQRLKSNLAFEVPFFYRSRLNHGAFSSIHGPKLYLTGSGGYDITDYFEERFGIEGESLEEGHNVITFALEIAHKMGCDPIFIVGMDLGFTGSKVYSQGVLKDVSFDGARSLNAFDGDILYRKDIYGDTIATLWKWVAESEWIGRWAKENEAVTLINCTEGGLGMPDVANKTLKKSVEQYLGNEWDLLGLVNAEVQSSKLDDLTEEKIAEAVNALKDSLMRSIEDFNILKAEGDRVKAKLESEHPLNPQVQQSGIAALAETDLADEIAYTFLLETFNFVYSQILNREFLTTKYGSEALEPWQRAVANVDINRKRLNFLSTVAVANVELLNYAVAQKKQEIQREDVVMENLSIFEVEEQVKFSLNFPLNDLEKKGCAKVFYPNGKLKGESHYEKGRLHGSSRFYSKEGKVLCDSTFVYGKLEGDVTRYYPSGEIYSRQYYHNGLQDGEQHYFYQNGTLKTKLSYRCGYLEGVAFLYNSEGRLLRKITIFRE